MKRAAIVLLVLARAASADPPPADVELGTPLPGAAAAPALSGVGILAGVDVISVPTLPASLARGGATFAGYSTGVYGGSLRARPGWFGFYSLDFVQGLQIAGAGSVTYFDIGLPALGYGYRGQHWLASVQVRPQIEHFGAMSASDWEFSVATDAQLCLQYNFLGISAKNSAACAFVAPVVYRDGFLQGESFGLRFILF